MSCYLTKKMNKNTDAKEEINMSMPVIDPTAARLCNLINHYRGSDDLKEIQKIFESGVDINVILDNDSNRPLHLACKGFNKPSHGRHDLVRYLIEKGADLNDLLNNISEKQTGFYSVCSTWSLDLIKLAVEHGATDKGGERQPVLFGLINSDIEYYDGDDIEEIVGILIKNGTDINRYGHTYSYGCCNYALICAAMSCNVKFMAALLKNGADVNHRNSLDESALSEYLSNHKSGKADYFEGVKLLVESGTNLNALPYLNQASKCGVDLKVVQYLIDSGARINEFFIERDTEAYNSQDAKLLPLHEACYKKNLDLIKLLVKNGANVNAQAKDKENTLPLMITKKLKFDAGSEYLIQMGASDAQKPSLFWSCFN